MKALVAIATNPTYLNRYIGIRDSKHHVTRTVLAANHVEITARYIALAKRVAAGDLEAIGASTLMEIRPQLRACYGIETKKLVALKADIKVAQAKRRLKYCPYCGTTANETHDHYLPASLFPEFAVNAFNLVPCCFRCNTIKDNDWLDTAGNRRYLHFYCDQIPDVDFVRVELISRPPLVGVGARFSIEQAGMDDVVWGLIQRHFDRLHLIDRYNENASDEIGEILEDCANHLAAGGVDVRRFLEEQGISDANVFGRSNWRSVLLRTLSQHPLLDQWVAAVR